MALRSSIYTRGRLSTRHGIARAKARGEREEYRKRAAAPPPQGMYDPALDASLGQVNRGYGDTEQDYFRDFGSDGKGGRAFDDYQLDVGDLNDQAKYAREDFGTRRARGTEDFDQRGQDLARGYDRSKQDLLTARGRGQQDFSTAIEGIGRQFQQLGQRQSQGAAAAGLGRGGALQQALRKRQANQTLEEQPVRTNFDRFMQDSSLSEGRLGEDRSRDEAVLGRDRSRFFADADTEQSRLVGMDPNVMGGELGKSLARRSLGYGRQAEDAGTGLLRAQRENSQFGVDTQAQRLYQATANGYTIPGRPRPRRPRPRPGMTGSGVRA